MKIVIASHHFPPHYTAGAEQYAYRLAKWLIQKGHQAIVVCVEAIDYGDSPKPTCTQDTYEEIPVHRLHFNMDALPDPFRSSYWNPVIGEWFERFLSEQRPDLVHVNSAYLLSVSPIEVAKDLDLPVVLTLHDYWFLCPFIQLLHPDKTLCPGPESVSQCVWCMMTEQRRYRLPDVFLRRKLGTVVGGGSRSKLGRKLLGLDARVAAMQDRQSRLKHALQRVDVAVGLSRFLCEKHLRYGFVPQRMISTGFGLKPQVQVAPKERAGPGLRIGYLGQLAPHKGVMTLVQAFNQLARRYDGIHLEFYGGFGHHKAYEKRVRQVAGANSRIQFCGRYDNQRVGEILSGLDVMVIPSVWYENRPTVILEALVAKTPVIGAAIGGIPELVIDQVNGLLFEAGNPQDLAKKIRRLLDEPGLLAELRDNIQPVKTVEEEMAELQDIYRAVMDEAG